MAEMKEAFQGINVCDFTWVGVGPLATKCLADFGATVIRMESIHRPDQLRLSAPFKDIKPGINRGGYYAVPNSNKYSLALNLDHPKSKGVVERLVAWADIVSESFAPGVIERLGFGYEQLQKIKPDIIMYRSSNQGAGGPHAGHPGYGTQLVGLSGFTHLTGWPDRYPVQPFGAYTDVTSFPFGIAALTAALVYHRKTGKGQYLDLSQYEASIFSFAPLVLDYMLHGRQAERAGNHHPFYSPQGVYRCLGEERWCVLTISTDDEWIAFCETIGKPEWITKPEFATFRSRKEHEDELDALIEAWTINYSPEEVMSRLQAVGVPASVVKNPKDLLEDAQLNERGHFWWIDHAELGNFPFFGQPFVLSKTPATPKRPSPCLGEHTEYVCREILHMSDEEFVSLMSDGVFE